MHGKTAENIQEMKSALWGRFPYADLGKLHKDFKKQLKKSGGIFNVDLDQYFSLIAGTLSYYEHGSEKNIPQKQQETLRRAFFEVFPQYAFLAEEIKNYPELYRHYSDHEKARQVLINWNNNIK